MARSKDGKFKKQTAVKVHADMQIQQHDKQQHLHRSPMAPQTNG